MNCNKCEYSVPIVNGEEEVIRTECWRFPPQIMVTNSGPNEPFIHSIVRFPDVTDIDFCFEFKEIVE